MTQEKCICGHENLNSLLWNIFGYFTANSDRKGFSSIIAELIRLQTISAKNHDMEVYELYEAKITSFREAQKLVEDAIERCHEKYNHGIGTMDCGYDNCAYIELKKELGLT